MFTTLAAIAATGALTQPQAQWAIGSEREVDEGVYMQVVASDQGWRVWKIETRTGVQCKAVKSAVGRPHPVPVGVSSMMARGTPFLEVLWRDDEHGFSYSWGTEHYGKVRVKYRPVGARFWEERNNFDFDADDLAEQRLEVQLTSWEYPAILVGYAEEDAIFDLSGLEWAKGQVADCEGVRPNEVKVVWLLQPTPAFPQSALDQGVQSGRVELECTFGSGSEVSDCAIVSETPTDVGFGEAALRGLRTARGSLRGSDQPENGRHRFFINFALQGAAPR